MLGCAAGLTELYAFSGLANPCLAEGWHSYTFEVSLIGWVVVMAPLQSSSSFLFFFFLDRLGGRVPVLQDIWPESTCSKQAIVLFCVSVIMGDRCGHPGIVVCLLQVSQGAPVCYNKMLDVCTVTEGKNMKNYTSVLFLLENGEKQREKRKATLNHLSTAISILV